MCVKTGVQIQEMMTNTPVTVGPDVSIRDAARLMVEKDVNSVLVERDGKLLGIVTDEDFVRHVVVQDNPATRQPISTIMVKDIITIDPRADLEQAMELMGEYNIRQIPVIDKKRLLGLVTIRDVLKIQPELIDILIEKYRLKNDGSEE